jgi:hypothetical protein
MTYSRTGSNRIRNTVSIVSVSPVSLFAITAFFFVLVLSPKLRHI